MMYRVISLSALAAAFVALAPADAAACPICFGVDPESDIGQAMNWAVFALLGVTGGVLSGFIAFIFHLIKRSRMALGPDHEHYRGERVDG